MEQNTFKSLLSRLSFDNILPAFKAIYQKLRPDLFEQTDWNIYRDIYQDLRTREADTSQYFILIFERWEDTSCPGSNCLPLNICSHALVLMTSCQISNIYIKRMHWTHFVMQIGKHAEKCTKIFKATKYRKHGMSSIWHPVGRDVLQ